MNISPPPKGDYPLEPALDFLQRLWRLNHAIESLSKQMNRRLGITAQQRLMIRCIGKFPQLTSGQLAEILHVDPGTVSAALNRLEEKGMLRRRQDPRDMRRTCVGLTTKGRELDRPTDSTIESAVESLLLLSSPEEVSSGLSLIGKLTMIIEEQAKQAHEPSPPPPNESCR